MKSPTSVSTQVYGNGGTLSLVAYSNYGDTSYTFTVEATRRTSCFTDKQTASHIVHVFQSRPETTALADTICATGVFYIKIANSKQGYECWADSSFAKVKGNGGLILLPCRAVMASYHFETRTDPLYARYEFPVYVRHVSLGCGESYPITHAKLIGRKTSAKFRVTGYEYFTGDTLKFQNNSLNAVRQEWKFSTGASFPSDSNVLPRSVKFNTPGPAFVSLYTYSKEGCVDSSFRTIEIYSQSGPVSQGEICVTGTPGNVVDSIRINSYTTVKTVYEDEYGGRIIAGSLTGDYPVSHEGWFANKFDKNGALIWQLRHPIVNSTFIPDRRAHVIIEQAIGDALENTYLLGHSKHLNTLTIDGKPAFTLIEGDATDAGCTFIIKVSPAGNIIWVKPFTHLTRSYLEYYNAGSILRGKHNDIFYSTQRSPDMDFYMGKELLFRGNSSDKTGVILQINGGGNIVRKRTFPISFYNTAENDIILSITTITSLRRCGTQMDNW